MTYHHTAVLLLGAILVVVCTGKDSTSTINFTYNTSIVPKHDCTTVINPTNTEYQTATPPTTTSSACHPSSEYTVNSRCICNTVTSTLTSTITTTTTTTTTITTTGPVIIENIPATLHGVYISVFLVLVGVIFTMIILVVYMYLMRRAKSGRVPQTTTGTTHTNNMAASEHQPIAIQKYMQSNKTGKGIKSQPTSQRVTCTQVPNSSNTGRAYRPSQPSLSHLPPSLSPNGDTVYSQISGDTCRPKPTGLEQETINENPAYGCVLTNENPAYGCVLTNENPAYGCGLTNTHTPKPTGLEQETINENPAYGCVLTDDTHLLLQAPTLTSNAVHSTQLSDVYNRTPLGDPEYELLDDVRKQSNKDIIRDKENKQEGEKQEHNTCTKQIKETSAVSTQPDSD